MDSKEVLELLDERKRTYASLQSQQRRADDFFELTHDFKVPNFVGMEKKRDPSMREKVMAGVQVFMTRWPRAEVDPRRDTETSTKQAAVLETLYNYMLWQNRPLWRELYLKTLLRGGSIGKIWFDDEYLAPEDEDVAGKALDRFPIQFSACDFLNCYPSRAMQSYFHPVDMIESYEMSMGEALYLCKRNGWSVGWKEHAEEKVKYTAYYDNDKRIAVFSPPSQASGKWSETVFEGENVLGFTPYVVIPSGLGQDSFEGKPEYKFRDIIYPYMEMTEESWKRRSQINYILSTTAYPQTEFEADDVEGAEKRLESYTDDPETIKVYGRDMKRLPQQDRGPHPALFQWLSQMESKSATPGALLGNPVPNTYSEVHYSTQAAYARALYELPLDNLEMGVAALMGMAAKTIEWLGNPVSIRNVNPRETSRNILTVKPSDIKGYYDMRVKFIGDTPESRDLRQQMGRNLIREQVLPRKRVLHDYFDIPWEEAETIEMELLVEEIRKMPVTSLTLALEYAEQRGLERMAELVRQELEQSGMNFPRGGDNRMPDELEMAQQGMRLHGDETTGPRSTRTG